MSLQKHLYKLVFHWITGDYNLNKWTHTAGHHHHFHIYCPEPGTLPNLRHPEFFSGNFRSGTKRLFLSNFWRANIYPVGPESMMFPDLDTEKHKMTEWRVREEYLNAKTGTDVWFRKWWLGWYSFQLLLRSNHIYILRFLDKLQYSYSAFLFCWSSFELVFCQFQLKIL